MLLISIFALVCAALFTGAAGYITLVEHPARLELEDAPPAGAMATQLQESSTDPIGLSYCRGCGWHRRMVPFGQSAVGSRESATTCTLAVYASCDHADQ